MSGNRKQIQPAAGAARGGARSMQDMGPLKKAHGGNLRFREAITTWTLVFFVVLPTVLATAFYGLIAAPRYVSEVRFIVRSIASPKIGGFDMLFRSIGISRTVDDAYVIQRYLLSRDAVKELAVKGLDLKEMFSAETADRLSRYPHLWRTDSFESLYDYYLDHVTVTEDSVKGILTLQAITFRPADSQKLATMLLGQSEDMVNRINERAQNDVVGSAADEVKRAEANTIAIQTEISEFRNKETTIDPSKTSVSVLDTITSLSTDLAFESANLQSLRASSPNNPGIPTLIAKIASLDDRIKSERAKIAGNGGALSEKIAVYEQLALRRELADKSLASAITSLESARQDARRQHIYIEQIVSANLPDESTQPERIRSIVTVFVFGFAIFAVTWILTVGAGEHGQ